MNTLPGAVPSSVTGTHGAPRHVARTGVAARAAPASGDGRLPSRVGEAIASASDLLRSLPRPCAIKCRHRRGGIVLGADGRLHRAGYASAFQATSREVGAEGAPVVELDVGSFDALDPHPRKTRARALGWFR